MTGMTLVPGGVNKNNWYCRVLHEFDQCCMMMRGIIPDCMVLRGIVWFVIVCHAMYGPVLH